MCPEEIFENFLLKKTLFFGDWAKRYGTFGGGFSAGYSICNMHFKGNTSRRIFATKYMYFFLLMSHFLANWLKSFQRGSKNCIPCFQRLILGRKFSDEKLIVFSFLDSERKKTHFWWKFSSMDVKNAFFIFSV